MTRSLYDRLGGADGVKAFADETIDRHVRNPIIGMRFRDTDLVHLKEMARQLISMGTGGPDVYTGKDIRAAHTGMNISEEELVAALDDAMAALDRFGVGAAEKAEVLAAFYSFKADVVRV